MSCWVYTTYTLQHDPQFARDHFKSWVNLKCFNQIFCRSHIPNETEKATPNTSTQTSNFMRCVSYFVRPQALYMTSTCHQPFAKNLSWKSQGVGGKVVVRANILGTVVGPSTQDPWRRITVAFSALVACLVAPAFVRLAKGWRSGCIARRITFLQLGWFVGFTGVKHLIYN